MPHSSNDSKKIEARGKELERQRAQELEDIKKILTTKEGERFFKRFLRVGMVFKTTFTGNSQTFFNEGHRNLALTFLNDICEISPEKIPALMKEDREIK